MKLNLPKQRIIEVDAAWWKRVLSFFIDFFIIQAIIISPFSAVITQSIPLSEDFMQNYNYFEQNPNAFDSLFSVFIVLFLLMGAYFMIFEYKMQQTPGKMLMKLKLRPFEKEELTIWKVIARNLAVIPIFPFSILWVLDPLYMIFSGCRLSDKISRTRIIEEMTA